MKPPTKESRNPKNGHKKLSEKCANNFETNGRDAPQEHIFSSYINLSRNVEACRYNCSRGFVSRRELLLHEMTHVISHVKTKPFKSNNGILKPFQCEDCDLKFALESTLKVHSTIHKPFPHICACSIGYYKHSDLLAHRKLVHPEEEKPAPVKPKKSIKEVTKKKKRRRHKKNNTQYDNPELNKFFYPSPTTGRFECKHCDKSYTQGQNLKKHILENHNKNKRDYECEVCQATFAEPSRLARHLEIHSEVKKHKCKYCPKAFHDPSALVRHHRTHTGEKKYACKQCPKAYTDFSALRIHRMRCHEPPKYVCDLCNKRFITKFFVSQHIQVIHQKKSLKCRYCKKKFVSVNSLEKHKPICKTSSEIEK